MNRTSCPACEEGQLEKFLEIPSVPVYCNVLWETREEALQAARGKIELGFCSRCALIYNMAFDATIVEYNVAYENSLHGSPRFQAYAEKLAAQLISDCNLQGKDIVEIGCGKGEFLALLCRDGLNRGHGFDASYDGRVDEIAGDHIEITRDYYSEVYGDQPADLILSRHVLEHIETPAEFVRTILSAAEKSQCEHIFTEVPDGMWTLRDLGIWDIIYEHCSYFTAPCLERLFQVNGFDPQTATSAFGGQFLCVSARRGGVSNSVKAPDVDKFDSAVEEVATLVSNFATHYDQKVAEWEKRLAELHAAGKRTAVWGIGSKGVTFLNIVPGADQIAVTVDINAMKLGKHVPGTGHEVQGPESVRDEKIDVVLVMNPLYREEIAEQLKGLGAIPELLCM